MSFLVLAKVVEKKFLTYESLQNTDKWVLLTYTVHNREDVAVVSMPLLQLLSKQDIGDLSLLIDHRRFK